MNIDQVKFYILVYPLRKKKNPPFNSCIPRWIIGETLAHKPWETDTKMYITAQFVILKTNKNQNTKIKLPEYKEEK